MSFVHEWNKNNIYDTKRDKFATLAKSVQGFLELKEFGESAISYTTERVHTNGTSV